MNGTLNAHHSDIITMHQQNLTMTLFTTNYLGHS